MALTFAQAITLSRSACRDANDDSFSLTDKKAAINLALAELADLSEYVRAEGTINLASGDPSISIAGLAGASQETVREIWIQSGGDAQKYTPIEPRSLDEVLEKLRAGTADAYTEEPAWVAWKTDTTGLVYPTPDAAYVLNVLYSRAHPELSADSDPVLFPEAVARLYLWQAVPALLRMAERDERGAVAILPMAREFAERLRGRSTDHATGRNRRVFL